MLGYETVMPLFFIVLKHKGKVPSLIAKGTNLSLELHRTKEQQKKTASFAWVYVLEMILAIVVWLPLAYQVANSGDSLNNQVALVYNCLYFSLSLCVCVCVSLSLCLSLSLYNTTCANNCSLLYR